MRIVHVNPYHYPFMGGIEHRIHHLCKRLAKNHQVFVLTGRLPGTLADEEIEGYRVIRLPSWYINIYNPPYVRSKGVLDTLDGLKPDIVDFHYRWAPSYTNEVIRFRGAKVHTFHNMYGEGVGMMRYLSLFNDMRFAGKARHFDRIICISEFVRRELERRGFDRSRLAVVPNGVEIPSALLTDEPFILSLGRMVSTKGLRYLVEAMREIDAPLKLAGAGPEEKRLRRLVDRFDLNDRISLLGKITEQEKASLYASCRLFAMPSLQESSGIAAAEAMAYSRPVVCTNVGGLPEVVGDGGIMVPPKDPKALADAINALWRDEALRKSLSAKARSRAELFTWDKQAKDLEAVYLQVLEERSGL